MQAPVSPYHYTQVGRWIAIILCCCCCQCVQTYVSPYKSPPTGYLVVEGYISANSQTQFTLSRTIELPGDSAIPVVTGATVQVQGSDSSIFTLSEQGNGVYGDTLSLNPALQYRLTIHTPNGENYASDFVAVKPSPPIDSINWIYTASNGVNIYANTHDPNNATHYYRWSFVQTWEYDMPQESFYLYDRANDTVIPRTRNQLVYRCWTTSNSTTLLVDNTTKLAQDLVYEFPLVNIPNNSVQISVLYSILVSQYTLTQDAYSYLSLMQANTESLGSIFDIMPTTLTGNIHCLNNPAENVIGYVSAGTVQQQRLFIRENQMPWWEFIDSCESPNYVVQNTPDSLKAYYLYDDYVPIGQTPTGDWVSNHASCVDCTSLGGSNVKPSFWPN